MEILDIWGEFPKNKSEVILGYDAAKELFPGMAAEDIIGKSLTYGFLTESSDLTISGINYKADMGGHVNSYFLSDTVLSFEKSNTNLSRFCLFTPYFYEQHPEFFSNGSYSFSYPGITVSQTSADLSSSLVCGRNVERDGEIVVGLTCIHNMPDVFGEYEMGNGQNFDLLLPLIGTEVVCGEKGRTPAKLTIVGIVDDSSQKTNRCYISQNDIDSMLAVSPNKIKIYAKDSDKVPEIIEYLEELGFKATAPYYYLKDSVGREFTAFGVVFVFIGLIIFLSSVKNVSSLIKTNVEHSLNEIGLLRTFGLSAERVGRVYFFETLAIASFALLISGLLFPLLIILLTGLTKIGVMSFVSIKTSAVIMGVISLVILTFVESVLATKPVMNRIRKNSIISLVRNIEQ